MVNLSGSGGVKPHYSFSDAQREEIKNIIKRYCTDEKSNYFIESLERGIREYLFWVNQKSELSIKTSKELKDEVTELQETLKKLFNQLGDMSHVNESMINSHFLLREKHQIPIAYKQQGYSWAESLQLLVQDISLASGDYLVDIKTGSSAPSYGVELHLVEGIYRAIQKCNIKIKIKDGTTSTVPRLVDCFIKWLDIKSRHTKKRSTADNDISNSPIPLASGKAIVRSWLKHGDNLKRTKNNE